MTETTGLTDVEIVELEPQMTAVVRLQEPMEGLDLASAFDRYIPLVMSRVQETGSGIAGPPFARYHRFGPDVVDVEIGFPVASEPAGMPSLEACTAGEVGRSELPGGPVARAVHRGSYEGLGGAYDGLHDWIHEQPGVDDGAGPWESYIDDPGAVTDQAQLRTQIVWPLVRPEPSAGA
jgi:effector-binding domain-containing protein